MENSAIFTIEALRILVLFFLLLTTLAIIRIRQLFSCIVLMGSFSLLMALFFLLQDAVDVAFTEAAVGAGMSTVLTISTLTLIAREAEPSGRSRAIYALFLALGTGAALIFASIDMPAYGHPNSPANTGVGMRYIARSIEEIDVPNVVTAVLSSYRGYDTLGETLVVFTAGLAVVAILAALGPDESTGRKGSNRLDPGASRACGEGEEKENKAGEANDKDKGGMDAA